MLTAIKENWDTLSPIEQRMLLCLSPFQNAVNMGGLIIIEYYFQLLHTNHFRALPFDAYPQLIDRCVQLGWMKRRKEFPGAIMMSINPSYALFLNRAVATQLNEEECVEIERSFVQYYKWQGLQLYYMFTETPAEDRPDNVAFMIHEYHNVREAIRLSVAYLDFEFTNILLAINIFLTIERRFEEQIVFAEQLRRKIIAIPEAERTEAAKFSIVDIYDTMGSTAFNQENFQLAKEYFLTAIEYYEQYNLISYYPEAIRTLYQNLAIAFMGLRKWEESRAYFLKMRDTAKKHGDNLGILEFHFNYGKLCMNRIQLKTAFIHFKEATRLGNQLEETDTEAQAYLFTGTVKILERQYREALDYLDQAAELFGLLDDERALASVWENYSILYLGLEDFDQMESYAKQAIKVYISYGMRKDLGLLYINMCTASAGLEEWKYCADYLGKAMKVSLEYRLFSQMKSIVEIARSVEAKTNEKLIEKFISDMLDVYSIEEVEAILEV